MSSSPGSGSPDTGVGKASDIKFARGQAKGFKQDREYFSKGILGHIPVFSDMARSAAAAGEYVATQYANAREFSGIGAAARKLANREGLTRRIETIRERHAIFRTIEGRAKLIDKRRKQDLRLAERMGIKVNSESLNLAKDSPHDQKIQAQIDNVTVALARYAARLAQRSIKNWPTAMSPFIENNNRIPLGLHAPERGRIVAENLRPQVFARTLDSGDVRITAAIFDGKESEVRLNPETGEVEFFNGSERIRDLESKDGRVAEARFITYEYSQNDQGEDMRYIHNRLDRTNQTDLVHAAIMSPRIGSEEVRNATIARKMEDQIQKATVLTGVLMSGGNTLGKDVAAVYVEHGAGTLKNRPKLIDETEELVADKHNYKELNGVVVIEHNSQTGVNSPSGLEALDLGDVRLANFDERDRRVMAGETREQVNARPAQRIDLIFSTEGARQFRQLSRAKQLVYIRQYYHTLLTDINELTLPINVHDESSRDNNIPRNATKVENTDNLRDLQVLQAQQLARTSAILTGAMSEEDIKTIDDLSDMILVIGRGKNGYTNSNVDVAAAMQKANEFLLRLQTEVDTQFNDKARTGELSRREIAAEMVNREFAPQDGESSVVTEMREKLIAEVGGMTDNERLDYVEGAVRDIAGGETVVQFNERLEEALRRMRGNGELSKDRLHNRALSLRDGLEELPTVRELRSQIASALDSEDEEHNLVNLRPTIQRDLDAMRERAEDEEDDEELRRVGIVQEMLDSNVDRPVTVGRVENLMAEMFRNDTAEDNREEVEDMINLIEDRDERERLATKWEKIAPKPPERTQVIGKALEVFDERTRNLDPNNPGDRDKFLEARAFVIADAPEELRLEVERIFRSVVPQAQRPEKVLVLPPNMSAVPNT